MFILSATTEMVKSDTFCAKQQLKRMQMRIPVKSDQKLLGSVRTEFLSAHRRVASTFPNQREKIEEKKEEINRLQT